MDKKNTLLLTVIAIATLLVAVIGATFAYFTAQAGAGAQANVNVTTSTTDTATFSKFDNLSINATLQNFDKDDASLTAATQGYVNFTPSNAEGRGSVDYCYTVEIEISKNEFIYSLDKTKSGSSHYPELILNVWKQDNQDNSEGLETIDANDEYRYSQAMQIDLKNNQLIFDDNVLSTGHICSEDTDYSTNQQSENCKEIDGETNKLKGYDITIVGNTDYDGEDDNGLKDVTTIKIPVKKESYDTGLTENDYIHKITVTGGASVKPKYDLWKASVTLVNYKDTDITSQAAGSGDQSKYDYDNDSNIGNAGRKFTATLNFNPTPCPN